MGWGFLMSQVDYLVSHAIHVLEGVRAHNPEMVSAGSFCTISYYVL